MNLSNEREELKMAGRIETKTTLFLDEKDYKTFIDFSFLLSDLASNLDNEYLDMLLESFTDFTDNVDVETEED